MGHLDTGVREERLLRHRRRDHRAVEHDRHPRSGNRRRGCRPPARPRRRSRPRALLELRSTTHSPLITVASAVEMASSPRRTPGPSCRARWRPDRGTTVDSGVSPSRGVICAATSGQRGRGPSGGWCRRVCRRRGRRSGRAARGRGSRRRGRCGASHGGRRRPGHRWRDLAGDRRRGLPGTVVVEAFAATSSARASETTGRKRTLPVRPTSSMARSWSLMPGGSRRPSALAG